jgi:hypothetical protein
MFIATKDNHKLIIASLCSAFIFLLLNFNLYQSSLDAGLVISGKVKYPEEYTFMYSVFYKQITFINYFSAFILKLTDSLITSARILIFIYAFILIYGFSLIIYGLSSSYLLVILFPIIQIFFRLNLGYGDYKTPFISYHNHGGFAHAFLFLILGFFFLKNYFYLGFFLVINLTIHLTNGLWVILNIAITLLIYKFFFNKIKFINKNFKLGAATGCLLVFLFFYYVLNNQINYVTDSEFNVDIYRAYLSDWDAHRSRKYIYVRLIFFYFVLLILSFIYLNTIQNSKKNINLKKFFVFLIAVFNLSGILIFFFERLFIKDSSNLFFLYLNGAMLSRFIDFISMIGFFIFIFLFKEIISFYFKKNFLFNKFLYLISFLFILFLIYIVNPKLFKRDLENAKNRLLFYDSIFYSSRLSFNNSNHIEFSDPIFWEKLKKIETTGQFVTSISSSYKTLRLANKPILFDQYSIDHFAYLPVASTLYKDIIEDVYGIDFFNLPDKYKNKAQIPDLIIKNYFQTLSIEDWINLKKKYNLSGLVLPNSWKVNLDIHLEGKDFNMYLIY